MQGSIDSPDPEIPQSGTYIGSFLFNMGNKVEIRDEVRLEFVNNSEGFYNVEGRGFNQFGHYNIAGIFKDGKLTIYRIFECEQDAKKIRKPSATVSNGNSSDFELEFCHDHTVLTVGSRVIVHWSEEENYIGTVLEYNADTGKHLIKYDADGEEIQEDLAEAGYIPVDKKGSPIPHLCEVESVHEDLVAINQDKYTEIVKFGMKSVAVAFEQVRSVTPSQNLSSHALLNLQH